MMVDVASHTLMPLFIPTLKEAEKDQPFATTVTNQSSIVVESLSNFQVWPTTSNQGKRLSKKSHDHSPSMTDNQSKWGRDKNPNEQ